MAGPAFASYHRMPTDTADLEVAFPTLRAVEATGDVRAAALPGGRVARVVHAGSFDGLGPAWERLRGWIDEQGLHAVETFWEVYLLTETLELASTVITSIIGIWPDGVDGRPKDTLNGGFDFDTADGRGGFDTCGGDEKRTSCEEVTS